MADGPRPALPPAARVVVVGAGIGGLASALLLAARGVDVTLVEAADTPGGKMRRLPVGDGNGDAQAVQVDAGPTVFTMRWAFEEILAEAGASLADLPPLRPLSVLARHAWRGSDARLDLFAERERSVDAVGRFAGAAEARRFAAFCAETRRVLDALEGPVIRAARPGVPGLVAALGPRGLALLAGLGPFGSLWSLLGRRFADPRLRQLFARYATYCGASPWSAPATLMLVAQVEMDGVWVVEGGLSALAARIAALARARGAALHFGCAVERIELDGGRVGGVLLADGRRFAADAVVFNGDPQALAQGLLGEPVRRAAKPLPRDGRSLSALTWLAHVRAHGFPLARHNVFFDADYASEFDDVFRRRRLPARGTVYVCAQDRHDGEAGDAPSGPERLLALVNAPADGDVRPFGPEETTPCETRSLALLRDCGLTLEWNRQQVRLQTPADFHRRFPASGGALYGMATHGWTAVTRRAGATTPVPGLFLAGGGVHPGPGVPMAALSGRLAAAATMAHLASTRRWHATATAGGTSTPSPTTAGTA